MYALQFSAPTYGTEQLYAGVVVFDVVVLEDVVVAVLVDDDDVVVWLQRHVFGQV